MGKRIQTIHYQGPTLVLATAAFAPELARVSGESAGGTSLDSYQPGGQFNSLTSLQDGRSYLVVSKSSTPNYDIPIVLPDVSVPATSVVNTTSTGTSGTATFSGTNVRTSFTFAHGLMRLPVAYPVSAASGDAQGITRVSVDAENITVYLAIAPPTGANNVAFTWQAT